MTKKLLFAVLAVLSFHLPAQASSGTEGAAFLDIPVGGRPAALGGAYTPLANDAYAATWNPAGLGSVDSTQFSGQHLSYLDTLHYEYLSFAVPLHPGNDASHSALGGSIQYLGSGDVKGMDQNGNSTGDFSSSYAAYNLSYGRAVSEKMSLGMTGKLISAKLADVSASAYAADFGSTYKMDNHLTLAATLTNLGSKLKFLSQSDSLPTAFHVGAAYQPSTRWMMTTEVVYPKTGLASAHVGGEWRPVEMISLRAGYRTDTTKELSALAGLTTGLGLEVWGQELDYAFLPMGDLGSTHYISLLMKFGEAEQRGRNLIQYQARVPKHQPAVYEVPGLYGVPEVFENPTVDPTPEVAQAPKIHPAPAVAQISETHWTPKVAQVSEMHPAPVVPPAKNSYRAPEVAKAVRHASDPTDGDFQDLLGMLTDNEKQLAQQLIKPAETHD